MFGTLLVGPVFSCPGPNKGTKWFIMAAKIKVHKSEALPGFLGIQGERLFFFVRDLGRWVIYFQGLKLGEKA